MVTKTARSHRLSQSLQTDRRGPYTPILFSRTAYRPETSCANPSADSELCPKDAPPHEEGSDRQRCPEARHLTPVGSWRPTDPEPSEPARPSRSAARENPTRTIDATSCAEKSAKQRAAVSPPPRPRAIPVSGMLGLSRWVSLARIA